MNRARIFNVEAPLKLSIPYRESSTGDFQVRESCINERDVRMPEKTKEIAVDSVVYEGATGTVFELIAIEGTVWMTMQQMAVGFGVDRSVVGKHVRNIYATEELERARTWAKFAQVREEGGRRVRTISCMDQQQTRASPSSRDVWIPSSAQSIRSLTR